MQHRVRYALRAQVVTWADLMDDPQEMTAKSPVTGQCLDFPGA